MKILNVVFTVLNIALTACLLYLEFDHENNSTYAPNDGQSGIGIAIILFIDIVTTAYFALLTMIFGGIYTFNQNRRNKFLIATILTSVVGLTIGIFSLS